REDQARTVREAIGEEPSPRRWCAASATSRRCATSCCSTPRWVWSRPHGPPSCTAIRASPASSSAGTTSATTTTSPPRMRRATMPKLDREPLLERARALGLYGLVARWPDLAHEPWVAQLV